jgi:hypothetical protein
MNTFFLKKINSNNNKEKRYENIVILVIKLKKNGATVVYTRVSTCLSINIKKQNLFCS